MDTAYNLTEGKDKVVKIQTDLKERLKEINDYLISISKYEKNVLKAINELHEDVETLKNKVKDLENKK